jgi:hypothetical protein
VEVEIMVHQQVKLVKQIKAEEQEEAQEHQVVDLPQQVVKE